VLELVRAYEQASGRAIAYDIAPRRAGDIDACFADPLQARERLGWSARLNLQDMCRDSWRWQQLNPQGYDSEA
jgi:UDP-glucose 4-epimerase